MLFPGYDIEQSCYLEKLERSNADLPFIVAPLIYSSVTLPHCASKWSSNTDRVSVRCTHTISVYTWTTDEDQAAAMAAPPVATADHYWRWCICWMWPRSVRHRLKIQSGRWPSTTVTTVAFRGCCRGREGLEVQEGGGRNKDRRY